MVAGSSFPKSSATRQCVAGLQSLQGGPTRPLHETVKVKPGV